MADCTANGNGAGGEAGKWVGAEVADWTDVEIGGRVGACAIDWAGVETVDREGDGDRETVADRAGVRGTSRATAAEVLTRGGGCALVRCDSDAGGLVLLGGFGGALLAKCAVAAISAGGGELGAA